MVEGCQAGGLGHLLHYMHEYNAESQKQDIKRFNSIAKTIGFDHLVIIYLCVQHREISFQRAKTLSSSLKFEPYAEPLFGSRGILVSVSALFNKLVLLLVTVFFIIVKYHI